MIPVLTSWEDKDCRLDCLLPYFLSTSDFKLYNNEQKYICYIGDQYGGRIWNYEEQNGLVYEDWLNYLHVDDKIIKDINSDNCLLVIADITEGYSVDIIEKCLTKFLGKFKIKKSNVLYFNGTFPIEDTDINLTLYYKAGFIWPSYFFFNVIDAKWGKDFFHNILHEREKFRKNNTFEHDYISLNFAYRYHRHYTAIKLFNDNFFNSKKTIITWHANNNKITPPKSLHDFNQWHNKSDINPKGFDHTKVLHSPYYNHNEEFDTITSVDTKDYSHIMFGIVTETWIEELDYWPTEKIIKNLITGQPFVLIGQYKMIDAMRKLGFYVYDDLVDHSYDNEKDYITRIDKALLSAKNFDVEKYRKNFNPRNITNNIHLARSNRFINMLNDKIYNQYNKLNI